MDEDSCDVSLRLWDVLERVGVSERMRQLRRASSIRREIQQTIEFNMRSLRKSMYIFGSSIEGTTTPGMHSDMDLVLCNESFYVVDHIHQAFPGESLLAVAESYTKPGYVKLQLVQDRTPLTIHNFRTDYPRVVHDTMGRVCLKQYVPEEFNTQRNGPADTLSLPGTIETDIVAAYRSRTIPRAAVESLLECTRTGWVTRDDVEEMIRYGCLFVGVGHPSSEEKYYEWRISFSLQERKLMFTLNPTQHKCYVLLKLIKDILTSKPDIGKSITSYHCKTCLFRVISTTRSDKWTPANLILCTFDCLTELLQCLCNSDCPNFFIKANNMFERRVYGELKDRLIHYLRDMLNEGCRLFYNIESDNIGNALRGNMRRYIKMDMELCRTTFDIYGNVCLAVIASNKRTGVYMKRFSYDKTARFLFKQLCYLSSVNTITEHSHDETKAAIGQIEPILHRFYAAHLASLAFSTDIHESKYRLLQASARHLKHAMVWDMMSGRLVYASILYRQGNINMCSNVLQQLEQKVDKTVIPICGCYYHDTSYTGYERIRMLYHNPDSQSMMKSSTAACTIFLPSHTEIIPTALQYELYRSVFTLSGSQNALRDDWFDLVADDSKVYLYFMQYVIYSRLNRPAAKQLAIDNLLKQLLLEWNLGHRETGYNLLGWIYSQEGQIEAAAYCFIQSWMIRPHHNAAKWNMLILIYRQYASRH